MDLEKMLRRHGPSFLKEYLLWKYLRTHPIEGAAYSDGRYTADVTSIWSTALVVTAVADGLAWQVPVKGYLVGVVHYVSTQIAFSTTGPVISLKYTARGVAAAEQSGWRIGQAVASPTIVKNGDIVGTIYQIRAIKGRIPSLAVNRGDILTPTIQAAAVGAPAGAILTMFFLQQIPDNTEVENGVAAQF